MPVPFLHTLSVAARLAYPAIVGGVRRGISANRIQKVLIGAGIPLRRSTLLDIVAATRGIFEKGGYLRSLRKGQRFRPIALPEAITAIKRRFAINVVVKGTAEDTGLVSWQHITLAMDEPMTADEMEALAMRLVEEARERYKLIAESAVIEQGVRWGVLGVL